MSTDKYSQYLSIALHTEARRRDLAIAILKVPECLANHTTASDGIAEDLKSPPGLLLHLFSPDPLKVLFF